MFDVVIFKFIVMFHFCVVTLSYTVFVFFSLYKINIISINLYFLFRFVLFLFITFVYSLVSFMVF